MSEVEVPRLPDVVAIAIDVNGCTRNIYNPAVLHRWWGIVGDAVGSVEAMMDIQFRFAVVVEAKPPLDGDGESGGAVVQGLRRERRV